MNEPDGQRHYEPRTILDEIANAGLQAIYEKAEELGVSELTLISITINSDPLEQGTVAFGTTKDEHPDGAEVFATLFQHLQAVARAHGNDVQIAAFGRG